jgi:hypothetical protein
MKTEPPDRLDGAEVICFTLLDHRHELTGCTRHFRDGQRQSSFHGLVIATYSKEDGVYLFYCGENWSVENDTFHDSVESAKAQAEFEFKGTSQTWIDKNSDVASG